MTHNFTPKDSEEDDEDDDVKTHWGGEPQRVRMSSRYEDLSTQVIILSGEGHRPCGATKVSLTSCLPLPFWAVGMP